MARVLSDYGYAVHPDGGDREQQFSCDLHGDGMDGTPSARLYPSSNSIFCFACNRYRDPIQLAREKEGLDFWKALDALERRYGLPSLPWEDEDERPKTVLQEVDAILRSERTYEEEGVRVARQLSILTEEREVPMAEVLPPCLPFANPVSSTETFLSVIL